MVVKIVILFFLLIQTIYADCLPDGHCIGRYQDISCYPITVSCADSYSCKWICPQRTIQQQIEDLRSDISTLQHDVNNLTKAEELLQAVNLPKK